MTKKLAAVSKFQNTETENPNDSIASWVGPEGAKSYKVSIYQINGGKTRIVEAVVEKPSFIFKDIVTKPLERRQNYVIKITATDGKEEGESIEFSLFFPVLPIKVEDPMLKVQLTRQYMDLMAIHGQTKNQICKLQSINRGLADQFTIELEEIEKIIAEKRQTRSLTMENVTILLGRIQKLTRQVSDATFNIVINGGKTDQVSPTPKPALEKEKPVIPSVIPIPPSAPNKPLPTQEHVEETPPKEKVGVEKKDWWKKHGKSVRMIIIFLTIIVTGISLLIKWQKVKERSLTPKSALEKTSVRTTSPTNQVVSTQEATRVVKVVENNGGVEKPLIIGLKNDNDRLRGEVEELRKLVKAKQIPLPTTPTETNNPQLELIQMVKSIGRLVGQHGSFSNLTSVGNINIGSGVQINGNHNQVTMVSPNPFINTSLKVQQESKKKCVYPVGWEPSRSISAPWPESQNGKRLEIEITSDEVLQVTFPDTRWKLDWFSPDSSVELKGTTIDGIWRVLFKIKPGCQKAVFEIWLTWNPNYQ